jgi:hypothetical protein
VREISAPKRRGYLRCFLIVRMTNACKRRELRHPVKTLMGVLGTSGEVSRSLSASSLLTAALMLQGCKHQSDPGV